LNAEPGKRKTEVSGAAGRYAASLIKKETNERRITPRREASNVWNVDCRLSIVEERYSVYH
jgi:hypothetical protein